MRVYCCESYEALSRRAASLIAAQVLQKPDCVLGLATGSSPVGTYAQLIEWYRQGDLSFAGVSSVNLDEYRGLAPDHDQSYRYFMRANLFDHIDIDLARTHVPDGLAPDAQDACDSYEAVIRSLGGIDLQLLGLGHNGHIGFNEPDSSFPVSTHAVDLAQSTLDANARFFENDPAKVPTQAYTMGIGTIMLARKVVMVVSGAAKADIVARAFTGPVTPDVPASILQLHPDFTLVGDKEALAKLTEAGVTFC